MLSTGCARTTITVRPKPRRGFSTRGWFPGLIVGVGLAADHYRQATFTVCSQKPAKRARYRSISAGAQRHARAEPW